MTRRGQVIADLAREIAPMEARAAEALPTDAEGGWQYEPKWDGFRCLVFKDGDEVTLRAKSGKTLNRFFPEMVALVRGIAARTVALDGELVIEKDGHLAFDALQMRLHPAESRIRTLSEETPARFVAFDMLAAPDGVSLVTEALGERRAALERFLRVADVPKRLVLSPCTDDVEEAARWLGDAGHGGTDGVVAKRLDQPYASGERAMVKVKRLRTADCVVGGFRYGAEGDVVGSLLLGLYNEDGRLDHVGFTSSIPRGERPALTRRLQALRAPPGFDGEAPGGPSRWSTERSAHWEPLKPELVVEVRFDHVTEGRFRHGTKLLRFRPDKAPHQCTFEQIRPPAADPPRF